MPDALKKAGQPKINTAVSNQSREENPADVDK
jgi:hypothetical protein